MPLKHTPTGRFPTDTPNMQSTNPKTREGRKIKEALHKHLNPPPPIPPEVITMEHLGDILANIAKEREHWSTNIQSGTPGGWSVIHYSREVARHWNLGTREACQIFVSTQCLGAALRALGFKVQLFNPETNKQET